MSTSMRAKMEVTGVTPYGACENLQFRAVCKSGAYPADGADENNSFAMFTPNAELSMTLNNPALLSKFKVGDTFYVDFSLVE